MEGIEIQVNTSSAGRMIAANDRIKLPYSSVTLSLQLGFSSHNYLAIFVSF